MGFDATSLIGQIGPTQPGALLAAELLHRFPATSGKPRSPWNGRRKRCFAVLDPEPEIREQQLLLIAQLGHGKRIAVRALLGAGNRLCQTSNCRWWSWRFQR
jgi:hypothetical protein